MKKTASVLVFFIVGLAIQTIVYLIGYPYVPLENNTLVNIVSSFFYVGILFAMYRNSFDFIIYNKFENFAKKAKDYWIREDVFSKMSLFLWGSLFVLVSNLQLFGFNLLIFLFGYVAVSSVWYLFEYARILHLNFLQQKTLKGGEN